MMKHVKRDPGSSTSNDQLSSLVNPQELTLKVLTVLLLCF